MSRIAHFCLLAAGAYAYLSPVSILPAGAETLEDVLATAYNSNPTLLSSRAGLRAADEQVPLAQSGWRPTVMVTGDAGRGRYFINISSAVPDSTDRSVMDYSLVLTQPLYRGGRTVAQTDQAENTVKAARAQLQGAENQVLLSAAQAYLDVVRDTAILKLNINNEQVLGKDLDMSRERFKQGELTRTDVAQAEARLAQANAGRRAAEGSLQVSRAAFVATVGRPAESPVAPEQLPALPATLEQALALAEKDNPAVNAADWQARSAHDGIDAVEGELLPTLALQGTYGRAVNEFMQKVQTRTEAGMLTLSMPLYEGGATYARARAQKEVWGQRLIEVDRAKRDAIQSATQGWEAALAARARVVSFVSQTEASQLALTGVKEEAKVGARTVIEVLNAEQELFAAKVNAVIARHDELVAAYQIRAAVGSMVAKALGLPVDLYDPDVHYQDTNWRWIGLGK